MVDVSGGDDLIATATSGVENLADLATSALNSSGPGGALLDPVVGALRDVWEGYFGVPIPPGTTNWNAYSHQQLYDMLWDNADVGEVSSMAGGWQQHSADLADNATALHSQRSALRSNWTGEAAEPAATQLGGLADATAATGQRAATVASAHQNAGDALASARNAMPPPPGDPTGAVLTSAVAGAGAGAAIGAIAGAGAGGIGAGPGALMGAAIGAVAAGGGSLFLANVAAAQSKAQAVHVMQTYESSLHESSAQLPGAGNTGAVANSGTSVSGYVGPTGADLGGGASWSRLTGGAGGFTSGTGATATGVGFGAPGSGIDALGEEAAAAESRGAAMPGMGGARRGNGAQDAEHRNKMPVVDAQLFADDRRAATPVIGL